MATSSTSTLPISNTSPGDNSQIVTQSLGNELRWTQTTSGVLQPCLWLAFILLWSLALFVSRFKPADHRKSRLVVDLAVLAFSVPLLAFSYPIWAFCVSLGGIVWTRIPGGALSMETELPSYGEFIYNILVEQRIDAKFHENNPESCGLEEFDHCLICWEENLPLRLPCNHFACRSCLEEMASARKSQCPYCQRALFRDNGDVLLCSIWNASLACMVVTAFLHLMTTILLVDKRKYVSLIGPGSQMIATTILSVFWGYLARNNGPLWWHVLNRNQMVNRVPRELIALAYLAHFIFNTNRAAQQMLKEDWTLVEP